MRGLSLHEDQPGRGSRFAKKRCVVTCTGLLILVGMLSTRTSWGQLGLLKSGSTGPPGAQATGTTVPPETPKDEFGRDSPYETVVGFLKAAEQSDWQLAANFLDSKQPAAQKQRLARQLKLVLDRGLTLDLEKVSKNPLGSPTEKWRATRNEIGTAHINGQSLPILLDLIQPTAKRPPYWLFASETLMGVPEIVRDLEAPWYEKYIPKSLLENQIFGVQLVRWVGIPVLVSFGFALVWLFTWVLRLGAEWVLRKAHRENVALTRTSFLGPLRILLLGYLVYTTAPSAPTLVARQIWGNIAVGVIIAGVGWLLICMLDVATEIAERRFRRQSSLSKIAPLKLASWGLRAFVAVAVLVAILYAMEINPTTVVTGLGLGGVALAFAAQKTIENVFGTVMIVVDQPVRVGDFCKIGEATGTIEEIGLRCTRVRTMNHTVLTVPNGQLAAMVLENFSSRQMIWFRHVIGLRYETTADQLRYVLAQIRDYLQQHPKVESGTSRVRFVKFGASSLDIELFAYILVNDYALFLGVQEEMLIRIMDIIAEAGTGVAFPSQTTYLAKDTGLDAEKTQAVIDEVRKQKSSVPAS